MAARAARLLLPSRSRCRGAGGARDLGCLPPALPGQPQGPAHRSDHRHPRRAGYASTVEAWTYTELQEVTLAPASEVVLFVVAAPFGLFLMALLFLVAGLLTPPSLERKGSPAVRRGPAGSPRMPLRPVRPGRPAGADLCARAPARAPRSFWEEYGGPEGRLDTGPLWFVGVLLVFSLGYAAWRAAGVRWLRRRESLDGARQITARTLTVAAVVVAPFSFAVRLAYPYGSESRCRRPQLLGVAGLHGRVRSRRGGQPARVGGRRPGPDRAAMRCGDAGGRGGHGLAGGLRRVTGLGRRRARGSRGCTGLRRGRRRAHGVRLGVAAERCTAPAGQTTPPGGG